MNVFMNLKNNQQLSNNERAIANYILEHPHEVLEMSSKELASTCYVSTATIYRLCDKLDLSGFSDLKLKITSSIDEYLKNKDEFDFDFPVKEYQTHYEIIHKIKEDYDKTLNLTMELFDLNELRLASRLLAKASIIDLYTSAGNIYFANNFQFQLQEIGKQVNVPENDYQQRLTAASSNETHVAVMITFGGRGILSDILPRILKKTNTPVILISSTEYNFKEGKPVYHFYIPSYENHYKKISSYSTRLSILYILDTLYTCIFELDYHKNLEKKLAFYNNLVEGNIDK